MSSDDHYSPPRADIRDDTPLRAKHVVPMLAAVSGPLVLILVFEALLQVTMKQSFLQQLPLRGSLFIALGGAAGGLCMIPFNQLRWYWGLVLGPVLTFGCLIVFGLLLERIDF